MQQSPDNYGQGPAIGSQDFGRPGTMNQAPHQQQHHRANIEMTPDEKRIFQECNRESYFKRSLPASIFLGGLAFFGVKRGLLAPHARFGAMPKMVGAALIGYFFGKVSYMETCREKFLTQLPNSNITIAIRKAKGEEVYYEESQQSVETTVVFDDNVNPELSGGSTELSDPSKKRFSYDDLREQHRRHRFQPQSPPQQQRPVAIMSPVGQAPPSLLPPDEGWSSEPSFTSRSIAKKANKYGDEGFE